MSLWNSFLLNSGSDNKKGFSKITDLSPNRDTKPMGIFGDFYPVLWLKKLANPGVCNYPIVSKHNSTSSIYMADSIALNESQYHIMKYVNITIFLN
jgi:hypothetical protein